MFRPCIDLHQGKVKQIVGSTLSDDTLSGLITNYESDRPSRWYADLYRRENLRGGHIIMLGPGNEDAAREAIEAWPGGFHVGGGINADNARWYLDAGASHVIITSYVFHDGRIDFDRLDYLDDVVGSQRLTLDLSCRRVEGRYLVATDRWQRLSDVEINAENLSRLARFCNEFLVHAVDAEGKRAGIDEELIERLGRLSPIPATYAGGARSLDDLRRVEEVGGGRVDLTIGSALDIFGGELPFRDVVAYAREARRRG